jgi:hypothetical protein
VRGGSKSLFISYSCGIRREENEQCLRTSIVGHHNTQLIHFGPALCPLATSPGPARGGFTHSSIYPFSSAINYQRRVGLDSLDSRIEVVYDEMQLSVRMLLIERA